MNEQNLRLLERFEKDSDWFHRNINKLRKKKLEGKFVAIKEEDIIASDKDIDKVIEKIRSQGEDPALLCVEFVYPKGTVLML